MNAFHIFYTFEIKNVGQDYEGKKWDLCNFFANNEMRIAEIFWYFFFPAAYENRRILH